MLKKSEAFDEGARLAQKMMPDNDAYFRRDLAAEVRPEVVASATQFAERAVRGMSDYAIQVRNRFVDGYVQTFISAWQEKHNALPDVALENARRWLERHLTMLEDGAKAKLAHFAKELAENPYDAFRWADGPMQSAADLKAVAYVRRMLDPERDGGPMTHEAIVEELRNFIIREARHHGGSTSVASNAMEKAMLSAMAGILERL
jgi:hypothetical protein